MEEKLKYVPYKENKHVEKEQPPFYGCKDEYDLLISMVDEDIMSMKDFPLLINAWKLVDKDDFDAVMVFLRTNGILFYGKRNIMAEWKEKCDKMHQENK